MSCSLPGYFSGRRGRTEEERVRNIFAEYYFFWEMVSGVSCFFFGEVWWGLMGFEVLGFGGGSVRWRAYGADVVEDW